MVVDVQCYEGRNLDTVTQAESLATYGQTIARDYTVYTAATVMVETAERLTEEHEPPRSSTCCSPAPCARSAAASTTRAWSSTPTCCARSRSRAGRRASTTARSAGAPGRTRPSTSPAGGAVCPVCRPPGSAAPAPETLRAAGRAAQRGLGPRRRLRPAHAPRGQWPGRRRSSSGTSSAGSARCGTSSASPRADRRCPPARTRRRSRTRAVPDRRRSRPRSCPSTWPSSWTATAVGPTPAACRGPKGHEAGEAVAARRRRRGDRGRRDPPVGVRLLDRELAALPGRGALPDGLQPRRDPPPPRPAERVGRPDAVGRATPAAVAARSSTSSRSPRSSPATTPA